jgi:hypothetical protein
MTTRRLLALAAVFPVAALVATAAPSPASARPAADRGDDRCLTDTPIAASEVAAASHLGCSLVGRVVISGRVSVTVPPPGMSVVGAGVGRHGEVRELRVTNTGTTVRAVRERAQSSGSGGGGWYFGPLPTTTTSTTTTSTLTTSTLTTSTLTPSTLTPSTLTPSTLTPSTIVTTPSTTWTTGIPTVTVARAGDPPACQDRTFNLEHHMWGKSLRYRINLGKMPQRFHAKRVVRQIRVANGNMRKGRNTCGKPQLKTPPSHYLGRTSEKPNITASGPTCGRANTTNIVGFGNLPGSLLGWTCYWFIGGRMVGADILLDNGPSLATKLPSVCTNTWDFEGTVTHEWGHAFGLAHTGDGHSNLTMQHLLRPCSTYARTLGLGDWLGMKKMYGAR